MKTYLADWVFTTGVALLVLGTGPLLITLLLNQLGIWPEASPTTFGPGLLSFITLWPGIALTALGSRRAHSRLSRRT
ncbi:MAG: hypothetical protein KGN79_02110 [Acidobacteriota bacterium]|nr:hypothetical protein [Acidobacteriota bacterium]